MNPVSWHAIAVSRSTVNEVPAVAVAMSGPKVVLNHAMSSEPRMIVRSGYDTKLAVPASWGTESVTEGFVWHLSMAAAGRLSRA